MQTLPRSIAELKQNNDVPVIVADRQGFITYINQCFEMAFGWTYDEIVGLTLASILPSSFQDAHNLSFSLFYTTEHSSVLNHPLILKAVTKDRREIDSEHFIIAEQNDGEWIFGAIIRPLES